MVQPLLVGFGNPLLDISVTADESYLAKYSLNANDAILASEQHLSIFTDLFDAKLFASRDLVAGGACQNTMRGAQWLLPPNSTTYSGCVGNDANADLLREAAKADGLHPEYLVDPTTPTGRCAVLINGVHRSLVTDLQAANKYSISHAQSDIIKPFLESAKGFYIEGYHLTVSPDTMAFVAKYASDNGKKFALNLSAPFIPQFYGEQLDSVLKYTDILFGNESEAIAFAESKSYGTKDIKEIAKKISEIPHAGGRTRLVVITQGALPTVIVENGAISEYPVIPIDVKAIVDTNGAGDAFAGGFMAGVVLGKSTAESVRAGNYVANVVIQRVGPTYPRTKPDFTFA